MTKDIKNSLRLKKIAALIGIVVVVLSSFTVFSFAAEDVSTYFNGLVVYQTIAPITAYFPEGGGTVTAFVDTSSEEVLMNSGLPEEDWVRFLTDSDYRQANDRIFMIGDVPYIRVDVLCGYSSITVNDVTYNGSTSPTFTEYTGTISVPVKLSIRGVSGSFDSGTSYYYTFALQLFNVFDGGYDLGYSTGFNTGYDTGLSSGTSSGYQNGYNHGYADGRSSTDSENLGQNLLGDTLNAPMNALNNFVIYESSSGFQVTLGLVVGAVICLSLFIAMLKIFAGG